MRRIAYMLFGVMTLTGMGSYMGLAPARADGESAPALEGKLPAGYRDWTVISVAHEEGNLNDLRAVLGNALAMQAYRDGKISFPDGTVIARLAWKYEVSEENNKVFGRAQSFVAGP